jgi:hypothetical protein
MKDVNWDDTIARQEGWTVCDVYGVLEILRLDDPSEFELGYDDPKFEGDADAVAFVASRAADGSEYHQLALKLVSFDQGWLAAVAEVREKVEQYIEAKHEGKPVDPWEEWLPRLLALLAQSL